MDMQRLQRRADFVMGKRDSPIRVRDVPILDAIEARTAHHEAGHAVAAVMHGAVVEFATTHACARFGGRVQHIEVSRRITLRITCAGPAAENHWSRLHEPDDWLELDDTEDDEILQGVESFGAGLDYRALGRVLGRETWYAMRFVRTYWSAIEAVAAALMEHETIDGATIERIIQEAGAA